MSQSIAIIELYQHDEVLRHYCEMLQDSEYNIKVFCSKVVYESLEDFRIDSSFEWEIQEAGESISSFLKRREKALQACDLVFITTALSDFKAFYQVSKANKTLLLVHNAHSFLVPEAYPFFEKPFTDRLRWMKLYFERARFYKKKMQGTLIGLAFPTAQILSYVKANFTLPKHLSLMSLPFAYTRESKRVLRDPLTITIPGTVVSELRDYDSVLHAFTQLKKVLKRKVQLLLLGKPKEDGAQIIADFQALGDDNLEVITFKEFISPLEYEAYLSATNFLLLPFKTFGRNHIYKEHLGHSKISGGINDMIRYGIPALIPQDYPLEKALQNISESYSPDQLADRLKVWIEDAVFIEKKAQRKMLFEQYRKEKVQADFLNKIESILNIK